VTDIDKDQNDKTLVIAKLIREKQVELKQEKPVYNVGGYVGSKSCRQKVYLNFQANIFLIF